jgi:Bacteriophage tail sheath protein
LSSDAEWKYVNVRRLLLFLEASIDRGLQWAVFEPNNEQLWTQVRSGIEDFLVRQWIAGALIGSRPEEAFFVRCDLSTMTQNDLDNGRLVCQVGVAPVRPAEFVIFRIGQWTADKKG